ncbi:hypothetical protein [Methanosarcina sp. DH2]|uniref:hypothetical protein n=1 Tax=Methanosarcina sp. DH2 TaxID=2605639 RepID=UPI001E4786DE|nr:hypothetical protein [Methanosarcina sp. DH2]
MERTGINEEQMRKLGNVLQDELISNGSIPILIHVINGHGSIDKPVPVPFPLSRDVTGTITAPDEGSWRVVIKKVHFDESGLKKGDKRTVKYSKGWGTDTIHVDVYWSIKKDTTFEASIDY